MNIYWIPTILLSLCLSSAVNMISSHNCKDKLRTFHVVRVSVNGTASVSCPNLTGKNQEEMRFHLYLGLVEVGNHTHDSAHNHNSTETVTPVGEGLVLKVNKQDHTVSFVLSGMTTERAGVYTCEGHPMYPPPIEKVQDEPQTVVLVEAQTEESGVFPERLHEHQTQCSTQGAQEEAGGPASNPNGTILITVILRSQSFSDKSNTRVEPLLALES
ncbi:uncharacterized protein LOC123484315 isoform X1 [Coregonus clupeaformis]|uniref:uncharacterized protein LOC123484315 isoform X1 n=1 Tax=Coregonus clupeaformis TaxID=59861 RepID=UPI001E1C364F|nr:uncharacterized protein LOC123484315 isoform X1 [Coregonus clupeaformis]